MKYHSLLSTPHSKNAVRGSVPFFSAAISHEVFADISGMGFELLENTPIIVKTNAAHPIPISQRATLQNPGLMTIRINTTAANIQIMSFSRLVCGHHAPVCILDGKGEFDKKHYEIPEMRTVS